MQSAIRLAHCLLYEAYPTTPLIMGLDPSRTRPPDQTQKPILCLPLHRQTRRLRISQDARHLKKAQREVSAEWTNWWKEKTQQKSTQGERKLQKELLFWKTADPVNMQVCCKWLSRSCFFNYQRSSEMTRKAMAFRSPCETSSLPPCNFHQ